MWAGTGAARADLEGADVVLEVALEDVPCLLGRGAGSRGMREAEGTRARGTQSILYYIVYTIYHILYTMIYYI